MVSSMTAYSRLTSETAWGHVTIEVQSLNRKHLEINAALPKDLLFLDPEMKKRVQKKLYRGKVNIYLNITFNEEANVFSLTPNIRLAEQIQEGWNSICLNLGIKNPEESLVTALCKESSLFQSEYKQQFLQEAQKDILKLLDEALDQLIDMRLKEGEFLKKELLEKVYALEEMLKKAKGYQKNAASDQKEKLHKRIEELFGATLEQDERFFKEVAILADKSDLTEEMARIESHLHLFKNAMESAEKGVGKKLDFITQELNREWNTIGSKCFDTQTSHLVIDAKGECEKIREQVQNIE